MSTAPGLSDGSKTSPGKGGGGGGGGGGGLSFEGTSLAHDSGSSLMPIPVPAGAEADDVLLATVLWRGESQPSTLASGWTNIPGATYEGASTTGIYSAWRVLDGSEGSTVDLLTTVENKEVVLIGWLFRNANAAPIDGATAVDWVFGDTFVEVPSVNGSDTGVLISGAHIRDDGFVMTIDSAMIENHNGAFGGLQYVEGHEVLTADGATGTRTHTSSDASVGGLGFSIAIQPA